MNVMRFCGNFSTTIAVKWKNCGIPSPVGKNKILLNPFDGSFLVHYGDISSPMKWLRIGPIFETTMSTTADN